MYLKRFLQWKFVFFYENHYFRIGHVSTFRKNDVIKIWCEKNCIICNIEMYIYMLSNVSLYVIALLVSTIHLLYKIWWLILFDSYCVSHMVPVIFLSCWNFSCKRWIALIKCCTDIWSFETFFEMEPKLGIFNRVLHRLNYNRFSKTRLTFVDLHILKISKFHHAKFIIRRREVNPKICLVSFRIYPRQFCWVGFCIVSGTVLLGQFFLFFSGRVLSCQFSDVFGTVFIAQFSNGFGQFNESLRYTIIT